VNKRRASAVIVAVCVGVYPGNGMRGRSIVLHAQSNDPILPQKTVDTTYPSADLQGGQQHLVHQGDDLQQVLDGALPGDEIVIDANVQLERPTSLNLPAKNGTKYIVIRSANLASLPASGTRVSPADAVNMPRIQIAANNASTISTSASA
jgi:hypothetical protein